MLRSLGSMAMASTPGASPCRARPHPPFVQPRAPQCGWGRRRLWRQAPGAPGATGALTQIAQHQNWRVGLVRKPLPPQKRHQEARRPTHRLNCPVAVTAQLDVQALVIPNAVNRLKNPCEIHGPFTKH